MRGTSASALLLFLAALATACGEENTASDLGTTDAGYDGGTTSDVGLDLGVRDIGPPDSGDAGFDDPATLLQGYERIEGLQTWLKIRGTVTSTMPPVLFLSSGPGHGYDYLVEPTSFLLGPGGTANPNRLLVYFDLAATGKSGVTASGTVTSSVTFDFHLTNLRNTIAFVNTFASRTGPVDLVGHGYGAGVAAIYAAQRPDDVGRLVLIAPYPSNVAAQASFRAEVSGRLSAPDNALAQEILMWNICLMDIPRCGREYWAVIGPYWMCRANRDLFMDMDFKNFEIRAWSLYIEPNLRTLQYDWRPQLEQIRKPTTIIDGPCNVTPLTVPQVYKDAIPGSTLHVVPNSGHFPMVETSTTFQAIVKRALTYP